MLRMKHTNHFIVIFPCNFELISQISEASFYFISNESFCCVRKVGELNSHLAFFINVKLKVH